MRILAVLALLLGGLFGGRDMVTTATYQIITPDGVTFNLNNLSGGCGYLVHGLENIGLPPVRAYTHYVPGQPGLVLDDLLDDARVITISHAATGADIDNVFEEMNDVLANYRYNRTLTLQPLRLRVTFGSKSADLYCYYSGMTTGKVDNVHALFGINLVAYDPYWYSTTATTTVLDTRDPLTENFTVGKINGLWTNMGASGTDDVAAMAHDTEGDLYIGGDFTDWDAIAAADHVAKYDVSAGTWSAIATTPLSGGTTTVNAIAIAANGDVYVSGDFLNAGGAATADYIAVKLAGGTDWTTITAGGACNGVVLSLCLTDDGYLWAGGMFDSIGGVAAECIAKYNIATGAWTAAAGFDNVSDVIFAITQGQDGTIYAGGMFQDASADPDADYLAYWTGTAWAAVGGTLDALVQALAVGADGKLYAGGAFTTWNGVATNYIGCWNGSAVSAMNGGTDNNVSSIWIDEDNNLYLAGGFTTAGGVAIYDGVAIWNGNSYSAFPVDFSATATVGVIHTIGNDLFVGLSTATALGTAFVPGDASVTYSGNVAYPPTITLTGAGTFRSLRNETSGVEVLANLVTNPGEAITINLGGPGEIPAGKSVTSSWSTRPNGGNLLGKILSPTALARFMLVPAPIASSGANLLNCYVSEQPVDYLDNNNQFSSWSYVTGLTTANTNAGTIYPNIVDDTGGFYHIEIYKVSTDGAANLIAHTATYNAPAQIALVADNASGVGGTVGVGAVTAIEYDAYVNYVLGSVTFYNRYDSLQAALD